MPTALAEVFLAHHAHDATSLRVLQTGGDTLKRTPPPGVSFRFENLYGPTECTVLCTNHTVVSGEQQPPIGSDWPPRATKPLAVIFAHNSCVFCLFLSCWVLKINRTT